MAHFNALLSYFKVYTCLYLQVVSSYTCICNLLTERVFHFQHQDLISKHLQSIERNVLWPSHCLATFPQCPCCSNTLSFLLTPTNPTSDPTFAYPFPHPLHASAFPMPCPTVDSASPLSEPEPVQLIESSGRTQPWSTSQCVQYLV